MAPLPHHDLRHPWLRYQVDGYDEGIVHSYEQRLETIWSRPVNRVHVLDFTGLTPEMRQDLGVRLRMVYTRGEGQMSDTEIGLDVADTLCFQLRGDGSDRLIPDKGEIRDYWIEISSDRDFLGSYVLIRDPVRRLWIPRELPLIDLHELRRLNIYSRFGDTWAWVAPGLKRQQVAATGAHEADERIKRIEEEMRDLRHDVVGLRGVVESFTTEQSRVSTWLISCMTHQLMDASGHTYQAFDSTLVGSSRIPYQRRVRPRTGIASTSAAPHTNDQPDP
ncbi:hypothetical protein Tco_1333245 [Tanacetum coccineum]